MYLSAFVSVILVIMSVLLMLGVVPESAAVIGGMFLAIALGLAGPLIWRVPP